MPDRDYYEILGVERDAGVDVIKKAYRQLALKYHPDRNPGDASAEELFKEASEAYEVLSDPGKRGVYDRFGAEGLRGVGFSPASVADIFTHFQDLFGDFFGGGGRRRDGPQPGRDLRTTIVLSFREAIVGVKREVVVERVVACRTCAGSGARPGTSPEPCGSCHGRGQVTAARGPIMFTTTCGRCRGRGTLVKTVCEDCGGEGERTEVAKVTVTFPAGIDDGMRVRVAGQGEPGQKGAPPGNLYVDVRVEPDEIWRRDGADLYIDVPVSLTTAALGGEVEIETFDAECWRLQIPAGTQPGEAKVMRRRGAPRLDGGGRGDLIAVVRVEIPRRVSRQTRRLLEQLERSLRHEDDE
ncbi:MAG: molecular chaperone DnaJ [Deltaproteobacteria bacterium]|nr:molecular chaperone DnaJ [Deltaproteobacteria bacterium]